MKYNIIGDTHGRTKWKDLVLTDAINIFVGDYFSPYTYPEGIDYKQCQDTFFEIMKFKEEHPETILLLGNHDGEYFFTDDRTNRYDKENANTIKELFNDDKDKFQIAVSLENCVLVTHAGVTLDWFERYADLEGLQKINDKTIDPNYVANFINELYNKGKFTAFDFKHNAKDYYDCYGETETHGPLWIRPDGLKKHNIFKDTKYYQVVGHTMDNKIKLLNDTENVFIVDVLAYTKESLIIDINEQGKIKFEINKK